MAHVVEWIKGFALSLGGPGLFVIAFLDSSFLSFPEVCDLLIVWLTLQHKERMLYYALMTTLGSVAGCCALYWVGRKGGEAFFRRRFQPAHVDRGMRIFRKYGVLAILVPSLLPPPMPFKIFVLSAGVAKVRIGEFLVAVFIGRGLRYFGEGFLALWYGEAAVKFLETNARQIGLIVATAVVAGSVAWFWYRRRRVPAGGRPEGLQDDI